MPKALNHFVNLPFRQPFLLNWTNSNTFM